MIGKSALLAGVSGLVGGELLSILLSGGKYQKVVVLVRKPLGISHPKLEEVITDFNNLQQYKNFFQVEHVYCCLGTTIKKAKSREAFEKVDLEYPLEMAKIAKEIGVEKFLVITSMGADSGSGVFYSRTKGRLEEELNKLKLKSLQIFRPSLLLGKRKEFRMGESLGGFLAKGLSFIFIGPLRRYKPIPAKVVALCMYKVAQSNNEGVRVYLSDEIAETVQEMRV